MQIFAFITGSLTTEESAASGDYEATGWVDPSWSRTVFHDSRNDVRPVMSADTEDEDFTEQVRDALNEIGACEDNGDGTFYGADSEQDMVTGGHYCYALHFVAKFFGPNGWTERSWHPQEAGISLQGEAPTTAMDVDLLACERYGHSWVAGMMVVPEDDVATVARERARHGEHVECERCERRYTVE